MEEAQSSLAAIVFTDIVGFSRLMSENESVALPRAKAELARLRELCEKHHGKVLKSTGDGLLMHFTSAVQAVACALDIQRSIAPASELPMQHRIGIHLGDVVLEDGDVMGDGVNIAARLQSQADPGGICISKTVYDVVKNRLAIQATFLGPRDLKNISEAVPIYKILIAAQASGVTIPHEKAARRPAWIIPAGLAAIGAVVVLILLGAYFLRAPNPAPAVAAVTPAAPPTVATAISAPLSPEAARVVGAWLSIQRRAVVIYLPDGRIGINLSFGDRKILGVVGTWKVDGDMMTVNRTDPAKTTVSHIVSITDSQLILQGTTGVRFLERIPMPDLPIVAISGLVNNPAKDPNRLQIQPTVVALPADQSYNLGVTAFNDGDYDQALVKFTEALNLKPDFYQALARRAQAYDLNNAYDLALADYDALVKAEPQDATHLHARAVLQIKAGHFQAAIDDETAALALKPDFVNALIYRGQAHTLLAQYPAALADLNAALKLEPNNSSADLNRGIAEKASGDVSAGQADIDHAAAPLASDPGH